MMTGQNGTDSAKENKKGIFAAVRIASAMMNPTPQ
jgi:hypothetical protein